MTAAATFASTAPASLDCVRVLGARTHNLRHVDVEIPHGTLAVITGPSGCGKSSLAFDTLFVEGQRQYVESLSLQARQLLQTWERPDVDLVAGLPPVIAIDQRRGGHNPRSTVATVTEIHDYLRVLMARAGEAWCYRCQARICQQPPEQIVADVLAMPEGTRLLVLAPVSRGRPGDGQAAFDAVRKAGFVRVRVDGDVFDLEGISPLARRREHVIEAVVDRLVVRESMRARLAESVRLAIEHGEGVTTISVQQADGAWRDRTFSTTYSCPACRLNYEELEPRTFSFNSPYGACPECEGLGRREGFDVDLAAPDLSKSLARGAIAAWPALSKPAFARHEKPVREFVERSGLAWETPLQDWPAETRDALFRGDGRFAGVLPLLDQAYAAQDDGDEIAPALELFRGETLCPACHGARLRPEARSVRAGGKAIHEIVALPIDDAQDFFGGLNFTGREALVAPPLIEQIRSRLGFLQQVGLGYLTLDRPANTLSGGELQRVRLASAIGSGLTGVCYILDEPSIGLHPRDNARLIASLRRLQAQGSTVLVVEHDEAIMREADDLIDMGPGAGVHGGQIVAHGPPAEICRTAGSLTGRFLSGAEAVAVPARRRPADKKRAISVEGATAYNLQNVDAWFPLGTFCCVTGVSGSGKSTLVNDTLARGVQRRLAGGGGPRPLAHRALRGIEQIDKLVMVDQSAIGRTPRSNPGTYTGVFDHLRRVFAATREARVRGYTASRFSPNAKGGRCEECLGHGAIKLDMSFLPDLRVTCPQCRGARFNRQTLEIRFKEKSLADVLAMSVEEALALFENVSPVRRMLATLQEVGLGYLTLGQPADTLSGGEAQRIKLAAELGRADTGRTLYILDEPTTGLHFDDVRKLLALLDRLVELGNTVLVIEHHVDVVKQADWVVDLGPEGGAGGGRIVATGTPEEIAALAGNATGRYLREALERRRPGRHPELGLAP